MMARNLSMLLILVVLAGCTSVRSVDVSDSDLAYSEVNRGVRGKVAKVTLRDGTEMNVVGARVDAESLSWLDRGTNTLKSVPTSDVRQVSVVKAGSGALRGLLFGVAAGAAFGAIRAVSEGDDPNLGADPLAVTEDEKLRIYPPAHAVYAALATTPLGAIIGTRRVYRFQPGPTRTDVVVER